MAGLGVQATILDAQIAKLDTSNDQLKADLMIPDCEQRCDVNWQRCSSADMIPVKPQSDFESEFEHSVH